MNDQEQYFKTGNGATSKSEVIGIWSSHMGVAL